MTDRTPTEATWKLVPTENMTDQMMDAGQRYLDERISLITSKGFTLPPTFNWHEFWGAMLAASPLAPAAEPVAGWRVTYTDESALLVFTEDEADEAIADARPGAVKTPLYTHPIDAAAIRAEARREALEEAANVAETLPIRPLSVASHACHIARAIRALADKGEAE